MHNHTNTHTHLALNGKTQCHSFPTAMDVMGDSWENLVFGNITKFSHGHHARAGGGNNTFNFVDTGNVHNTIVGRLEDFDPSRDTIRIEGRAIDLQNLPDSVKIFAFNGAHNDANALPQQWISISTSGGGRIFYALEGARIDMNGNGDANFGTQEAHFMPNQNVISAHLMTEVKYTDPQNFVPAGYKLDGGIVINDVDVNRNDVLSAITGTSKGDLIAGGLNDDIIWAQDGNDAVWGGSGHDKAYGNAGADQLFGGSGNDQLNGGGGNDRLHGGIGNDVLVGSDGNDLLCGQTGNDRLFGDNGNDQMNGGTGNDLLFGGTGNDVIVGASGTNRIYGQAGDDRLFGGCGKDVVVGGSGADVFEFRSGDLVDWDDLNGTAARKIIQLDIIADFEIGVDTIVFSRVTNANSIQDLDIHAVWAGGNKYFSIDVRDTNERILVDVPDATAWTQLLDDSNFIFV